jgi:molybdopterin converting factor small subunit
MYITLILRSILRKTIGHSDIVLELPEGSRVSDAVRRLADTYGDETKDFLYDKKTGDSYLLYVVNKQQVRSDHVLKDKDRLTILPPIAGG